MSAIAPMEAPIAADAPVDRLFELEDEEVLVAEAEEVFVAELGFTLEVGVAVAGGVFVDRC